MRAAGLSRRRALQSIIVIGAWLSVATAIVGELLTPSAERLAQTVRLGAMGGTVGAGMPGPAGAIPSGSVVDAPQRCPSHQRT